MLDCKKAKKFNINQNCRKCMPAAKQFFNKATNRWFLTHFYQIMCKKLIRSAAAVCDQSAQRKKN